MPVGAQGPFQRRKEGGLHGSGLQTLLMSQEKYISHVHTHTHTLLKLKFWETVVTPGETQTGIYMVLVLLGSSGMPDSAGNLID